MTLASAPSPAPPRASVPEALGIAVDVLLPLVARGLIARRPRVVDVAERFDADRRAVRRMPRVRDRHRPGPVVVRLPGRTVALIVDPDHVRRVLDQSPEPISTANREKWATLASFQPHGVLISDADQHAQRRPFNERVLDTDQRVHGMADPILVKVGQEAERLTERAHPACRRAGTASSSRGGGPSVAWSWATRRATTTFDRPAHATPARRELVAFHADTTAPAGTVRRAAVCPHRPRRSRQPGHARRDT